MKFRLVVTTDRGPWLDSETTEYTNLEWWKVIDLTESARSLYEPQAISFSVLIEALTPDASPRN